MNRYDYSLGIDVSKDKLDCAISTLDSGLIKVKGSKKFCNSGSGLKALLAWVEKKSKANNSIHVVVEATGVYHEDLCYYLHDNSDYTISVLLPVRAKYYFKSLNVKTKTDKVDSCLLARYGLERASEEWRPQSKEMRVLKEMSRQYRGDSSIKCVSG